MFARISEQHILFLIRIRDRWFNKNIICPIKLEYKLVKSFL